MSISRNEAYELIAACEQAGLSRQKTKDLLNNQGYAINSKQLVCAMSKNIKGAPDNLLVVSERAEDRLDSLVKTRFEEVPAL